MESLKSRLNMLVAASLCILVNSSLADTTPDSSATETLGSYKTVKISASPEYSKYKKPAKGDPVDMAYEFFELNKERLGIENPRIALTVGRVVRDPVGAMVSFRQIHNGYTIAGSDIRAFFTREGELREIEGDFQYDINLPSHYSIDSSSAVRIALKESGPCPRPKVTCPSKPVIIPSSEIFRYKENRLYMAWPVRVDPDSVEHAVHPSAKFYRYYIDALDGSILQKGVDTDFIR